MLSLSASTNAAGPEPNIHDANRKKIAIVIQPRCKEYVLKQRSLHTLSCFSASSKAKHISRGADPRDTADDATAEPSASIVVKPSLSPTRRITAGAKPLPSVAAGPFFARPRALITKSRPLPTRTRATVASGRIEKPRTPPRPRDVPDLPMDAPAVVAARYELYSCGCSDPPQCQQCTLRRLVDKFCAIVTARKEKLRREASAIC